MSFSPPNSGAQANENRPIHKPMPMRRPFSTSSLFTVTQTSTNCFKRRPQRSTMHRVVSAQTLPHTSSPPLALNEEDDPQQDASQGHMAPAHDDHTSAFSSCFSPSSHEDDDNDSEYSDHDLWNSAMQSYLLDSDDGEDDDSDDALSYTTDSLGDQLTASPFLVRNVNSLSRTMRRDVPARKRSARKSVKSTSSLSRMTPSHSSQMLDVLSSTTDAQRPKATTKPAKKKRSTHRHLLAPLQSDLLSDGGKMGPLTIVFDIDETLVSARDDEIYVRPYVKDLLDLCAALRCEVIVWTAGVADYVNPILRKISVVCDRTDWYHHVISRHHRWYSEDKDCCKDLSLLNRPIERLLLIENNPVSVLKHSKQSILVEDYVTPNGADETLKHVASIVRRLVFTMSSARTPVSTPPLGPLGTHPNPVPMTPVTSVLPREAALVTSQFLLYEVLQHAVDHSGPPPESFEKLACYTLRYSATASGGRRTYGGIVPLT